MREMLLIGSISITLLVGALGGVPWWLAFLIVGIILLVYLLLWIDDRKSEKKKEVTQ